jgi:hypothetical protein
MSNTDSFSKEDCWGKPAPKVVSTLLYTEGSQKVNAEVEKDLKVPDPDSEAASAAIREATHENKTGS